MTKKIRIRIIEAVIWVSCVCLGPQTYSADFPDSATVGFRSGLSTGTNSEDFQQYELFLNCKTGWDKINLFANYRLSTTVNLSGGALTIGDETEFIGSAGPRLVFSRVGCSVTLEGGISATILGDKRFGNENFGGQYQFTSHVGTNLPLGRHMFLNLRFQHMSNASLSEPNPGLDLFMFGLSYQF